MVALGRRQEIAELGPFPAHYPIRLGARVQVVVVQRGEVLEVENIAEVRLLDAEVDQPAVQTPLGRFDRAACGNRIILAPEGIEVPRRKRAEDRRFRGQADGDAQDLQRLRSDREDNVMLAHGADHPKASGFAGPGIQHLAFERYGDKGGA